MPTPEGVPVAMMVPGISVMPEESSSIISVIDVISRSVTEFCRSSPLIYGSLSVKPVEMRSHPQM